ncbi:MAG: glycosyltransferase family 9 protein [Desulfovibrionaceae bacterium]|nr:glycosyltransferase family 9 protein [Desulfovibrionaceae bacterium]
MIRLSALGDVALTTGILLRWQETLGLSFTVLTREAFAPLFERHPAVREVVGLKPDDMRGARQRRLFRDLAARFRGVPLVDLHGTLRTRMLSALWQAPVYRYPKYAVTRRLFLLSGGRMGRASLLARNVPQRYAAALDPLSSRPAAPKDLLPFFPLTEEERAWSLAALSPLTRRAGPVVALHPFATHPAKAWPAEYWRELSLLLTRRGIAHVWIGRGNSPALTAPSAAAPSPGPDSPLSLDLTNRTDVRQLIALLAQADALVTGDSGPMHLASGVSTPVLALFGPTCREWGFFPAGERDRVLQSSAACRPCSLHGKTGTACGQICMRALTPDMVAEKLRDMLPPCQDRTPETIHLCGTFSKNGDGRSRG